jgi:hypothetical protein
VIALIEDPVVGEGRGAGFRLLGPVRTDYRIDGADPSVRLT